MSWQCATCGESHEDIPLSFAVDYPDDYANLTQEDRESRAIIASDQCVIDDKNFYVRGLVEIPIQQSETKFFWGVWASVSSEDFTEIDESWEEADREKTHGPFKGRLANLLPAYRPSALNLELTIHSRPVGERPVFVIDDPSHALTKLQCEGLTQAELQTLVASLLH